ncbi:MAG: hydroxyacid dehydrogenase [Candidatus Coatesbacteria bacterium]|nr:MAG: hydroxyacid dehydrogenase [Candidatus Coatesbacteria bacterium]
MLILISDAFAPDLPDRLARFGEVTDDKSRLPEAEVALVRSKTKCTKEWLDEAKAMKLIIRGGVGLDNIDREYAKEKGVNVHNTAAASSIAVAEVAFALMLAMPNHLIRGHNSMETGDWIKKELKRTELYGKTLGLLGAGRIGTEFGKRAEAFGMKVLAYDPYLTESEFELVDVDTLLAESDYVSLHMPLTDETKGMVNKDFIAKMKDGARIVNSGRGKCVVEEDVVEALKSGKLAGFATDVWYSDPPETNPFIGVDNVVMLPHLGASTKENMDRIGDIIVELLEEYYPDKE